jgi:hypothetical protein
MVPAEDSEEVLADLADALPHSSVFVVLWNMVQVRTVRMGLADRMGAREAVSSVK